MTPEKHGHGLERYQALHVLRPINTITAGSLKDAAATSLALFTIPKAWGTVYVVAMGMTMAAAGGAQTTAGTAKLQIAAADVTDDASAAFTMASVVSHAAFSSVETELDQNSTNVTALAGAKSYPTLTSEQKCELLVATQGVGAGDQTMHPYLLVKLKPNG